MRNPLSRLAPAAVLLCLLLTACSSGTAQARPFDPAADAQTLLDSGAFSEPLVEMEQDVACDALYKIDSATVTGSAVYTTPTAGAEELAIFTLTDEKAAQTVLSALQQRVEDQRAALENYQPDEVGKLDNAIVEQRGASVLLLVPADADAAKTALDSLS